RRTELIAPPSLGWEVGNALSAAVRRKRITAAQASQAFRHFGDIPVRIADIDVVEAVQLSFDRGIFAYDAYIIQCALRYRTPLLTLDRRQAEVASNVGVALLEV
ncbi:MAG: putative nucleic acid-binding protein, partial [Thalassolituus oleivorans]